MTKEAFIVLIDRGHGSDTLGKRSPILSDGRQLFEYKWNREVGVLISEMLSKYGIKYEIINPEETDLSLKERVTRANNIHTKTKNKGGDTIYISVHVNAAGNGINWMSARGWSTWTSVGKTKGDELADCLYESAHETFDPLKIKVREDKSDGDPDYESNFYVVKNTSMPAVLTENFFMDNKNDCEFLLSDEGKRLCAKVHVDGIIKYMKKKGIEVKPIIAENYIQNCQFHKCNLV